MPETIVDVPLEQTPEGCCWLSIEQSIAGLDIPNVQSVARRLTYWDDELATPSIVICPVPELIDANAGNNEYDEIIYSFMITALQANNRDVTGATAGWLLLCMRTIRRAFLNKVTFAKGPAFPDGPKLIRITVEPGGKFIEPALRRNYDAGYLLVRCAVWEPRS